MPDLTHPCLVAEQYRDGSNLDARIALHRRFSTNPQGWFRWLFDRLSLPPQCRILELGCGTGVFWRVNVQRIPPSWDITLTDLSPGMVQEAVQMMEEAGRRVAYAVVDAQAIPFPDAQFDAVLANYMLYHVADRHKAFGGIRRVLRPDGRLFAATNGRDHLRELDSLLRDAQVTPEMSANDDDSGFSLENGLDQLRPWFHTVRLYRYDDALRITEAEPLLAYIRSLTISLSPSSIDMERLAQRIERDIRRDGSIHITKSSGLFEAWNDG